MSDTAQQFREMMERFEYRPKIERIDAEAERFFAAHGMTAGAYLDAAEGLVPLKQKPEPIREIPAMSGDVYATMKRWA